jgi:hypothetical protein
MASGPRGCPCAGHGPVFGLAEPGRERRNLGRVELQDEAQ